MHATLPLLRTTDFPPLYRDGIKTLQVNLGYHCNQACLHCHVNAGPGRKEMMDEENLALVLRVLETGAIATLDLTGGAPELHAGFRALVAAARARNVKVIDRCNLTVLFELGQEDLAEFLATHQVEVIASLPCYTAENVDRQRGRGVFDKSIAALRRLNELGYGRGDPAPALNLVYNPIGPTLPPEQGALQADYKRELRERFGVAFDGLFVLANMPIQRFGSMLVSQQRFDAYMHLLKTNHDAANLSRVMCRTLVSVDWQGYLYDCDFNQQLGLPLPGRGRPHLRDLLRKDLAGQAIRTADHCYGCTAGQGSSCGGALHDGQR
jgi:radical SAM/Cys-rich protein